jgi:hypothetical protein
MTSHIVTEGPRDVALLRELLAPEREKYRVDFFSAGAKSAADSLARSILLVRHEPVILVVDADSTDPSLVKEQQDYFTASLREVAPPDMWRVCLAIPEVEICFFDDIDFLQQLLGVQLTEEERARSKFQPKQVLESLFRKKNLPFSAAAMVVLLHDKDISPLRNSALITEIRKALEEVSAHERERASL